MAIDGKPRHAERVPEHHVGRLASDARQCDERLHRARHLAAMGLDDFGRHAQERARLRTKEPGRLDLRLELAGRRARERVRVRVAAEERGRDLVDPLVGALRREDRRDEQLVGVGEMQLGVGVRVLRAELFQDASGFRRRLRWCGHALARSRAFRHAVNCSLQGSGLRAQAKTFDFVVERFCLSLEPRARASTRAARSSPAAEPP